MRLILFALLSLSSCGGDSTARPDSRVEDSRVVDTTPIVDSAADVVVPATCATDTPLGLSQCVEGERYQADLVTIAEPRLPGSAKWQEVQDLAADRLAALGFTVERHDYGSGINVVGVRPGTTQPDRQVLVAAHYDHIAGCAGADDNATGTAATLEAARVLAMRDYPRTLVVALWDEEERGLLGSEAYARRAQADGDDIIVNYNLEMVGFIDTTPGSQQFPDGFNLLFADANRALLARESRADFLALIADESAGDEVALLERYGAALGLPIISIVVASDLLDEPLLGDLRRSDHSSFWDIGVPGIMLTDTSNFRYANYHCAGGPDVVENLDQAFTTQVIETTVAAAADSLGL